MIGPVKQFDLRLRYVPFLSTTFKNSTSTVFNQNEPLPSLARQTDLYHPRRLVFLGHVNWDLGRDSRNLPPLKTNACCPTGVRPPKLSEGLPTIMPPFNTQALALPRRSILSAAASRTASVNAVFATGSCQSCASFTTTTALQTKTIKPARLPTRIIPAYPYGERPFYKQSNKGLYGSARIRFGNNVSERHKVKTPRFWRPNILVKNYYSPSVGANIKTRLTMRVLKTIKKEGGLENYLLKNKPARIRELGPGGWNLRWLLMQTTAVQEKFNLERVQLGLDPKPIEDRSDVIQFALDVATPGPLSQRSKFTQLQLREELTITEFTLGNESLEGETLEVTDEVEEQLLNGLDEAAVEQTEGPRVQA